jgi:hypothetical protein
VKGVIFLRIVVPPHDVSSPAYIRAVDRFCEGASDAAELLDILGLSKPRTRAVTGTHTPGTGEIHLRKRLGEGGFGVVTHLWNVSTGSECVVKEPVANAVRKKLNFEAWEREARIMGLVSHVRTPFHYYRDTQALTISGPRRETSHLGALPLSSALPGICSRRFPGWPRGHNIQRDLNDPSTMPVGAGLPPWTQPADCTPRHQARQYPRPVSL